VGALRCDTLMVGPASISIGTTYRGAGSGRSKSGEGFDRLMTGRIIG
jgi:hypothetical protein